ncbi:hypothetical protein NDU88_006567 [Pleurodeles waltl]|uniref:Secreted protein n=1 Tax=Pleurodeles waltl TaxID=8319 RepID=A0AAV7LSY6_PLEWA|nr:hypothetical protein NDU88_006567 [Pleurodeles waltl]
MVPVAAAALLDFLLPRHLSTTRCGPLGLARTPRGPAGIPQASRSPGSILAWLARTLHCCRQRSVSVSRQSTFVSQQEGGGPGTPSLWRAASAAPATSPRARPPLLGSVPRPGQRSCGPGRRRSPPEVRSVSFRSRILLSSDPVH